MQYNILDDLNSSYFVNPPPLDEYQAHNPFNSKAGLFRVYNDIKLDPSPHGYSRTLQKEFLRVIVIKHYDRGGHVILPAYFTCSETGVEEIPDPKYASFWDNFEMAGDEFKRLKQLTYNHILPDGKIIEYIFDHNNHYNYLHHNDEMFSTMRKLRNIYKLEKDLSEELDMKTTNNKIVAKI